MNAEVLHEIPVFQGLKREHVEELSTWLRRMEFGPGQQVFAENSPPEGLYVLSRGKVEVLKNSEQGPFRITELEGPSVFGEIGFLTGESHSAGVVASTPIVVGLLPMDLYEVKVAQNNLTALHLAYNIGLITCQRLRATTEKLLVLSVALSPTFTSQEGRHVSTRLTEICKRIFHEG